jgi:hypothetical protein
MADLRLGLTAQEGGDVERRGHVERELVRQLG